MTYLYHKLLCCLYVLLQPAITVTHFPCSHAWFQKPLCGDAGNDPTPLLSGAPAQGGWFGNLLGSIIAPLLLLLVFTSLDHLATELQQPSV